MLKNKSIHYTYLFLAVIIILIVPGNLPAQAEQTQWVPPLPTHFDLLLFFKSVFPLFIKFWPLIVIVIAALIKTWLLKKKLSVPWKVKPLEKLSIAALGATVVELFFLFLMMSLFAPAVHSLLKGIGFLAGASENIKFMIHLLVVIPYYCFLGATANVLLINLITPLGQGEQRRKYFKTSAFLALIAPAVLIIIFFVSKIFVKGT